MFLWSFSSILRLFLNFVFRYKSYLGTVVSRTLKRCSAFLKVQHSLLAFKYANPSAEALVEQTDFTCIYKCGRLLSGFGLKLPNVTRIALACLLNLILGFSPLAQDEYMEVSLEL